MSRKDSERLRSLFGDAMYSDRDLVDADVEEIAPEHRPAVLREANAIRKLWEEGSTVDASDRRDSAVASLGEIVGVFAEEEPASMDPRALAGSASGELTEADGPDSPRRLAQDIQVY